MLRSISAAEIDRKGSGPRQPDGGTPAMAKKKVRSAGSRKARRKAVGRKKNVGMKTVVVAGDLVYDHNLIEHPRPVGHHRTELSTVLVQEELGGAWFLKDLVERACGDLGKPQERLLRATIYGVERGPEHRDARSRLSHAYQIWSQYKQAAGPGKGSQAWRISKFLGCQRAGDEQDSPVPLQSNKVRPDVLVLDDLGLGFRDNDAYWPDEIKNGKKPRSIILKTSSPDFTSPLWNKLVTDFPNRLTVVISAASLRDRGAELSQALSWDSTIEEVVRELEAGISSAHLGRCKRVIVHFGSSGVCSFTRRVPRLGKGRSGHGIGKTAGFERFLYDPMNCEGTWKIKCPGRVFGDLSILTASMVRHELWPEEYPLFIALGRALCAMRKNQETGASLKKEFSTKEALEGIEAIFRYGSEEPAGAFHTAYPMILPKFEYGVEVSKRKGEKARVKSDLLRDLTGKRLEYVAAKAMEVVIRGPRVALAAAPQACYGDFLTVDRQEIERFNAINNLILNYKSNPKDTKPLSIAVFGPPGSGKSFGVKQLLGSIFGGRKPLEFNLSQFRREEGHLAKAFHQVRDMASEGKIPLVLWDEFDVDDRRWLQEFLVPMQDAKFMAEGMIHPLGKAIFVFAGGVSRNFQEFSSPEWRSTPEERESALKEFKAKKVPDFVSRLQGYINVKGLQPACPSDYEDERKWQELEPEVQAELDPAHLIRRAIVLRSALQRNWPHLIDPGTKMASISAAVLHAFLRVKAYRHGARSMMSLVRMSRLGDMELFTASALPPKELLAMLVSDDFTDSLHEGHLDVPVTEILAEACHKAWMARKKDDGYEYGEERDDTPGHLRHPRLLAYDSLRESWKEDNRKTARLARAKIDEVRYRIVPRLKTASEPDKHPKIPKSIQDNLAKIEHDIWLRDHLLDGYEYAPVSNDRLRLHKAIAVFKDVDEVDRALDYAIVESIPNALWTHGYRLVPKRER
jgi:hypothetical protein